MIDPWTALRAPVWAWAQWRARSLVDVPRPRDAPRAHTPGPDAVDVLIVGSGTASGWGVLTHELGLIGAFCRAVAQRRQGGVTVAGVVEPSMRMSDVTAGLQQQALGTFQVVCLVLGVNDVLALTSRAAWARELARALDEIERSRAGDTQVLVAGIQPLQSIPTFAGRVSRLLARRARQLNELTSAECERRPGVAFVEPPPTPGDVENVYGDSARYAFWAEVLAGHVAPGVLASAPARERRAHPDQRERALARIGIADSEPEERFDRIVRAARSVFQTSHAAFTVVGVDRQWYKALAGSELDAASLEDSFCFRLVEDGGPLIVPDASSDPRFTSNAFVVGSLGLRFYAGYPVRASTGEPIGAVCVFDSMPRDTETIDVASLREFALMVEAELADERAVSVSGRPARHTEWPPRRR